MARGMCRVTEQDFPLLSSHIPCIIYLQYGRALVQYVLPVVLAVRLRGMAGCQYVDYLRTSYIIASSNNETPPIFTAEQRRHAEQLERGELKKPETLPR